jgi:hypothetical protein
LVSQEELVIASPAIANRQPHLLKALDGPGSAEAAWAPVPFPLVLVLCASPSPVALSFHVVVDAHGQQVAPKEALGAMVSKANALHAGADVHYELGAAEALPKDAPLDVMTARERDALSALLPASDGRLHVFIVRRLANKDLKGGWLAGVHWHAKGRHYLIISAADSGPETLAHEMGHVFGLSHSRDKGNLMSQAPERDDTHLSPAQLQQIRRGIEKMRARGELK